MDAPPLADTRARLVVAAGLSPRLADAAVVALLEGLPLLVAAANLVGSDFRTDEMPQATWKA